MSFSEGTCSRYSINSIPLSKYRKAKHVAFSGVSRNAVGILFYISYSVPWVLSAFHQQSYRILRPSNPTSWNMDFPKPPSVRPWFSTALKCMKSNRQCPWFLKWVTRIYTPLTLCDKLFTADIEKLHAWDSPPAPLAPLFAWCDKTGPRMVDEESKFAYP